LRNWVPLLFALLIGTIVSMSGEIRVFLPQLLHGALLTALLTVASFVLALIGSFVLGLARLSKISPLRWIVILYIELFRGTSLLVQLFWLFYVMPELGLNLPPIVVGCAALSLNFAAYGAEIVRGAILSVSQSQYDAVVALNIGKWRAMRRIILPQALAVMIPPFGNIAVDLMKSTALVSTIALSDLTFAAYQMNTALAKTLQIFGVAMLMYYIGSQIVRAATANLERRVTRGLSRGRV
jgi:polar amino acid transport system permease protein